MRTNLSQEDNMSRYLFVCTDPHALVTPLRVSGQHKIWKLKKEDHRNAIAQLELS